MVFPATFLLPLQCTGQNENGGDKLAGQIILEYSIFIGDYIEYSNKEGGGDLNYIIN